MRSTLTLVALIALVALTDLPRADAQDPTDPEPRPPAEAPTRTDAIFFAITAGLGLALPDDPQFDPGPTLGGIWEITFGWGLTDSLALGIDFGTWQNSWLGLPFHFHNAFAPRLEFDPGQLDGLVLSLAVGLGTTDGVRPPNHTRHGLAITPRAAWRWDIGQGSTLALVTGLHVHPYLDFPEVALIPFLVGELRIYGDTGHGPR